MPFSHLANIRLYVMMQYIVGKSKEICPVQYYRYIATIMLALMPQLKNACKKPIILLAYTCLVYKALQHMWTK